MRDPKAVELRRKLNAVLEERTLDDRALLAALEPLATDPRFAGLSHEWAPTLYDRNRTLFRPFLLAHANAFGRFGYYDPSGKLFDPWDGPGTKLRLEKLLADLERDGDAQLFRRLYAERNGGRAESFRADLKKKFLAARTDAERRAALEMFDLPGAELDEPTALALYEAAPEQCGEFLLAHAPRQVPWNWAAKIVPWKALRARAAARGDRDLEQKLFRRQATADEWAERVRAVSRGSTGDLLDQLALIHPEVTPKNAAEVYRELLEAHGPALLPYVMQHLDLRRGFWSSKPIGGDQLIALAERKQWLGLWAALIRSSTQGTYNDAISQVLEGELDSDERKKRLLLLAGVGRELNFPGFGIAQVMPLTDKTAVALYRAYPELLRTVFRAHVTAMWGAAHEPLARAAIDAGDEELIDWLASRAATLMAYSGYGELPKEQSALTDLLSRYYEALTSDRTAFARRAGNVLSSIPAHAVWNYDALVKNNRLARLLFERSDQDYLEDPVVVRDLLESPQIYVNRLAYRVLATDSPAARAIGERNVDLLNAALLRKLHRQTRALAIDALANVASSLGAAQKILPRARDALRLPDKRYPKEKLIALIGTILHRHPSLRGEREQPTVFGVHA